MAPDPAADDVVFRVTRRDIEHHAGRPITDDELTLVEKALEMAEIDSVVAEVVYAVCGAGGGDDDA